MANPYYSNTGFPQTNSFGSSAAMRAELKSIEEGFDKLPAPIQPNQLIGGNAAATGLEPKTDAWVRQRLGIANTSDAGKIARSTGNDNAQWSYHVLTDYMANLLAMADRNAVRKELGISDDIPGIPGSIYLFSGTFGGANNKFPIDRRTGVANTSFAICDGGTYTAPDGKSVTTPDLSDRFIVGSSATKVAGTTGGSATSTTDVVANHQHGASNTDFTTLSEAQMPLHYHGSAQALRYSAAIAGSYRAQIVQDSLAGFYSVSANTDSHGGNGAHNHPVAATPAAGGHSHTVSINPLWYAIAFIMRL